MVELSVVICTLNPRPAYLRRVLDALAAQTLPKENWELLLVDNASDKPLSHDWDLSWHPRARHVREVELGLTPARLRGIRESAGEILVFVDDDNLLAPDYLQRASALLAEHPFLGVIGAGILEPEFAVTPAPELLRHLGWLALRRVPAARWSNSTNDHASVPWGAGLCVTRRVAQSYQPLLAKLGVDDLVDRRGDQCFGNGDVAFSWSSVMAGQGFGVFPQLHVTHLISADRLTARYFLRLVHDATLSGGVLDYLWAGIEPGDGLSRGERYLRLSLRGVRRGLFALRLGLAEARGAAQAKAYIAGQRLRPIEQRHT